MMPTPTLAKIKLNGTEYYLKDADARDRLSTIEGSYIQVSLYTTTLASSSWSNTTPATYTYVNASLACGKDGTIPPIIDCTSGESGYALIDDATATAGMGITFTAATKPTVAIGIRIMDFY